jgi:hypothetical protein
MHRVILIILLFTSELLAQTKATDGNRSSGLAGISPVSSLLSGEARVLPAGLGESDDTAMVKTPRNWTYATSPALQDL